jgi:CHAT domain-containing protein/Tfp pilus assembly protein PilF
MVLVSVLWLGSYCATDRVGANYDIPPKLLIDAGHYADAQREAEFHLAVVGLTPIQRAHLLDLLVEARWRGGKSTEAETLKLADEACALKTEHRLGGRELAASLYQRGNVLRQRGEHPLAHADFERSLQLRVEALGALHPEVAQSLAGLAVSALDRGDLQAAQQLFEQALAIRLARQGERSSDTAQALNNLAMVKRLTGAPREAAQLLRRAIGIWERTRGRQHPFVGQALENLAALERADGRVDAASRLLERALVIKRQALGDQHPALATTLEAMAETQRERGALDIAHDSAQQALSLIEASHPAGHERIGGALHTLGAIALQQGRPAEAQSWLERALTIRSQALGEEHPATADTLVNLALAHQEQARYAQAIALYRRALAIRERTFGESHPLTADLLDNLGNCELAGDERAQASLDLERAYRIRRALLGENHASTATSLHNLAIAQRAEGALARARELLVQALAIRQQVLGATHPDAAATEHNLAEVMSALGEHREAAEHFRRASTARQQTLGSMHLATAESLEGWAVELIGASQFDEARRLLTQAESIRLAALAPTHPLLLRVQLLQAQVALRAGDPAQAFNRARRTLDALDVNQVSDRTLSGALLETAGRAQLAMGQLEAARARLQESIARWGDHPDAAWAHAALGEVELARGDLDAALREAIEAERISRQAIQETARTAREVTSIQAAMQRASGLDLICTLMTRAPTPEQIALAWDTYIRSRALVLDRALSAQVVEIGLQQVRAQLPTDAVLVAYAAPRNAEGVMVAFVQRHDAPPQVVPLAAVATIEQRVRAWRETLEATQGQVLIEGSEAARKLLAAGESLREAIWSPIASAVQQSKLVLIVPDGPLYLASIPLLPADAHTFLVESDALYHQLSTERDIVRPAPRRRRSSWLGVADPVLRAERNLPPLPGTRREVEAIAALWPRAMTLTGVEATRTQLVRALSQASVLHAATHGLFASGDDPQQVLRASGLVLSPSPDGADLWSAAEIGTLDLKQLEWVVLSACDTGRGSVLASEGVLGLRRAFHAAGVATTITSLWPVSDATTTQWMIRLYRSRLGGASTAEAMRHATLESLNALRRTHRVPHPLQWGAFVATGDWN